MLKKIYQELVEIRKELQAVRSSLEPKTIFFKPEDSLVRSRAIEPGAGERVSG